MPLLDFFAIRGRRCAQFAAVIFAFALGYASNSYATFINVPASVLNGNELSGDFSQDGELDFDTRFTSFSSMSLRVEIGDTDGTGIAFSGFHLNDSGVPWQRLRFVLLGGPTFIEANQVIPDSAAGSLVTLAATRATIDFLSPESLGVTVGEPGDTIDPGLDWLISLNGLASGDSFTLVLSAVPAPGTLFLFAAGFAGWVASRRPARR